MSEIHERIAALEAQLAELKQEVAAPEGEVSTSRRDVFKKLALGAAGVAAGGALLAKGSPAAAADPNDVVLNASNASTASTLINYGGGGAPSSNVFTAHDGITGSFYPAGVGGYATGARVQSGVYGYSSGTGYGTIGYDAGAAGINKAGLFGRSTNNVGAALQGGRAALNVLSNGAATAGLVGAVKKGDILATDDGTLWFADADGSVVPLGGASAGNALYFLNAPARAYDSRSGAGIGFGPLNAAGGARAVSLATGTAGGATVAAVPAGATGALISVTLDATVGSGFLAIFAGDISWPGNSNANWYATGQILAVTTVSVVDATSKINLQVGGGGSTQVIVDVIGYYA